jgi:hypothetical protein
MDSDTADMHSTPATRWCRWLSSCGLTHAEIANLLGLEILQVESVLATRRYAKTPVRMPAFFGTDGPLRFRSIRGETGTYLRRLHELGYPMDRIAELLVLRQRAVAEFIDRLTPAPIGNAPRLVRPRSASEQHRVDATLRHRARRSSADRPIAPRGACHDDEGCQSVPLPIAPPAIELVHQVVEELPTIEAPPAAPWEGPWSPHATAKRKTPPPCPAECETP